MSDEGLRLAQQKMVQAGVSQEAIDVFSHYYRVLETGETGLIPEDTLEALPEPPTLASLDIDAEQAREALSRTAIIKLNGGLGTSMGMDKAKSLLPVRDGKTFLDLIVDQVLTARARYGARLPLILMDSFRTQADTLAALDAHPDIAVAGLPLDFLQNQEPKLRTDDLTPVTWPADPSLEWCPPGHGDLYTALLSTGILDALLDHGFRYASVSNSDNLGASPDPALAGWFAATGAPYAIEVCRRTPADRKGGHLAQRSADGRVILRESAQTDPGEMRYFTDETRHAYFNTNNLWFDLQQVRDTLTERGGVLGLPLIRNTKTVDPADPNSPQVYQIETAMGAAVEVFDGATAVTVERDRFLPVKTTNDLLLLRSDVYRINDDATLSLTVQAPPLVDLDDRFYKRIGDFEARFPSGAPSLRRATSFTVRGDWTFDPGVTVRGHAVLDDDGSPRTVTGDLD
ncbi:MAG TPA: UTP--glucose-1-phosphate uridylyltransferase [Dermatophilaceae bacterium]|nr:UTP--glucose-1-phosphate uridylyltransferase [Dermatophilaceae bacterium]